VNADGPLPSCCKPLFSQRVSARSLASILFTGYQRHNKPLGARLCSFRVAFGPFQWVSDF
jgi:hypothetical protein